MFQYFSREENLRALDPELQEEVRFGLENSKDSTVEEIIDNVRIFLEHGDEWRVEGEKALSDFRPDSKKVLTTQVNALAKIVPMEVSAWGPASAGAWKQASLELQKGLKEFGYHLPRGYSAVLYFPSAVWLGLHDHGRQNSAEVQILRKQAEKAAGRSIWLREIPDLDLFNPCEVSFEDAQAVENLRTILTDRKGRKKAKVSLDDAIGGLMQRESSWYERGLTSLGELSGAKALKPKGSAQCDSAWMWGERSVGYIRS